MGLYLDGVDISIVMIGLYSGMVGLVIGDLWLLTLDK